MLDSDPSPHRTALVAIIGEIDGCERLDATALREIQKRHPKGGGGLFSKREIIAGYRRFAVDAAWRDDEATFLAKVRLKPVRTQSGVAPVTVLTKPFPCPGKCIFCPDDVRMPKSYLRDEPGAQRAELNGFDPYLQTWNRLRAFHLAGHAVDKVELLILGGTWSSYPEPYQRWFVERSLAAMNDFGADVDGRLTTGRDETAVTWDDLAAAQRRNEAAGCRNVGLVVETRPDHLTEAEVIRIRRLGATKVQLGYQSLDDRVLAANRRGHGTAETRSAMRLLRLAGLKTHAHWMPNLHTATVASDIADFAQVFDDLAYRPDELKIYPCSLIESAELMERYRDGSWRPYERDELLAVLTACLVRVPRYCRVTRVIRDIPSTDIVVGNRVANLREVAAAEINGRGERMVDIRAREIRGDRFDHAELELRETSYETSIGRELFLEFTTPDDRIVGFLRLSLPREAAFIDEIAGGAMIREVHVYGSPLSIGDAGGARPQHRGLGGRLIEAAVARAAAAGYLSLAVISAIGTREYYRRVGFADGELYQHRALA